VTFGVSLFGLGQQPKARRPACDFRGGGNLEQSLRVSGGMRALQRGRPEVTSGDSGQVAEFGRLFELHRRRLFKLAMLLTAGEREFAEDAVANAFLATYPRWSQGAVLDPGAYLRRSVVNQIAGGFRRRAVERRHVSSNLTPQNVIDGAEKAVDDRAVLWRALRALPPRQRAAVVLRYYGDLSEAEVADVLGVSIGTVKSQTARALVKLRRSLGGMFDA
jgi:RNA polymerase sigma-70 factor (sigma-E family)